MEYDKNGEILREFYARHGLAEYFECDNAYLESAFDEINRIWFDNLCKIDEVNYLMIAEAPLWSKSKNYIYNPATPFTQFFQKSDLEYILNVKIRDKAEFTNRCNEISLLIIDISPFALNTEDTIINYRRKSKQNPHDITKREYRQLIRETLPTFFNCKIKELAPKASGDVKVFFPLCAGKKHVSGYYYGYSCESEYYQFIEKITDISQKGGNIKRIRLIHSVNLAQDR